jgi:dipeptidyl aminopeptidase/acylaminoacyl peptidase
MTRMKKTPLICFVLCMISYAIQAQKKPLDHTVYDNWQSIGERLISNDGKWVVFTINPQEGDNELVVRSADGVYSKNVARGYNALITEDSRFLIFRIRPFYKDIREARIKKKKPEESPKDSLAIIVLGRDSVWKLPRVKSYKTPAKSYGWVAYHLEKPNEPTSKKPGPSDPKKVADSLSRIIDSLQAVIHSFPNKKQKARDGEMSDAEGDDSTPAPTEAGTTLVLRKLQNGEERTFNNVLEYYFSKNGQKLLMEMSKTPKDSMSKPYVLLYDLRKGFGDTISRSGNDFRNFTLSDDGSQVAYLAERDAKPKDLQKFYKIWYYKEGMDSASLLVDKNSVGMHLGMTVSENGTLTFTKLGNRLFFGTAPIQPPKDTTLVDIDAVKVDVWHYNDDYLQTTQLFRLQRELQRSYMAVYLFDSNTVHQLASNELPTVYQTNEGDGDQFVGVTDYGRRVESQWTGSTKSDIYAIDVNSGTKRLVKKDLLGDISPSYISPTGKYIMWYDNKARNYFVWDGKETRNVTAGIKTPLYDELNDVPDDPSPYGVMKWTDGDSSVLVYERFGIWKLDPLAKTQPRMVVDGRKMNTSYRYIQTDPEERYIRPDQQILVRTFNENSKRLGFMLATYENGYLQALSPVYADSAYNAALVAKARDSAVFIYTKENYVRSPDLYVAHIAQSKVPEDGTIANKLGLFTFDNVKLSSINPQQQDYIWGTAELFKWKTFKGKESTGILYKPEDFNPDKKYPVIAYFYEKLSDGLNGYMAPAPTPSRLNIPFFVSRGYIVFAPDISYTIGHPAQSAYDYIVSGAKALTKYKWIDEKNMGIQGQSWGGIQVAQLVTMTDMFKAAWAGAPVANMTSAYGGIRWESGLNRQFQYEKTQSRIGATLWEKPELYIENSPLFHLPKVKTPLVIMSNDADGAVPWYQGIELFTGLRRLGKKVWLLNYNGEAHNLVERRNRKDIQIREQQFFDWLLKGEKPARWITEGVPAVDKGKDWGLELVDIEEEE